ncbi:slipin family protein [Microbulbifer aggregans]|uniref:slipin family protein n=1 Tax=Microbulbifer aggregans TaxID=1769779 RepID=UPI001CFD1CC6|nr:slipin family protein [Microbulbifer aggregans]
MFIWKCVDIGDTERALLFRNNRFVRVLEPGRHRIWTLMDDTRIELHDISKVLFRRVDAKFLLKLHGEQLGRYIESYELGDTEVGLVYRDDHLTDIVEPGTFIPVWKGLEKVRVEIVDIGEEYTVDEKLVPFLEGSSAVGKSAAANALIQYLEVAEESMALLMVNGKLEQQLKPGRYGFWKYNRSIKVSLVDLKLQTLEVGGQEILTKDKVSLRINLSSSYRVVEPKKAVLKLGDYAGFIYRELQLRLREVVGTQSLDAILEDKDSLNVGISEGVRGKLMQYGIEVATVGVKDIILPGDMKLILNQVMEAQKESEANLIKRREETHAMRSLHNTAKMMENSPVLLRLKELEALERVTARIDKISVYGGLDSVLNDLVKLKPVTAAQ